MMLYNLLLLLPINKWVNKKKREIKKEKKNINSGDNHQQSWHSHWTGPLDISMVAPQIYSFK